MRPQKQKIRKLVNVILILFVAFVFIKISSHFMGAIFHSLTNTVVFDGLQINASQRIPVSKFRQIIYLGFRS